MGRWPGVFQKPKGIIREATGIGTTFRVSRTGAACMTLAMSIERGVRVAHDRLRTFKRHCRLRGEPLGLRARCVRARRSRESSATPMSGQHGLTAGVKEYRDDGSIREFT